MVKIAADTVDDFIDGANKEFGGNKLGETEHHAAYTYSGFKKKKLVKLVFTCPIDVSYAEVGSGKPDPANKKAIAEVAAVTKKHELNHKAYYEKAFNQWNPTKVAKELMDTEFDDQKDADAAIDEKLADLIGKLLAACLDLHKKEGSSRQYRRKMDRMSSSRVPRGLRDASETFGAAGRYAADQADVVPYRPAQLSPRQHDPLDPTEHPGYGEADRR